MTATSAFRTSPQPNQVSKGAISCDAAMVNSVLGVWVMSAEGTPVDGVAGTGTGGGFAAKGSLYIDVTAGKLYINGGTKASTVWKLVTSAA